jgi:hypothetical protein
LPFAATGTLRDLKLVSSYMSWNNFGKSTLATHGIRDFGEGLISGDVLVLSNDRQNNALRTFFNEHHGLRLDFKRLSKDGKPNQGVYEIIVEQNHAPDTD